MLPNGIPRKGEALNRLSVYWFNETSSIIGNHIIDVVDPRIALVKKTNNIKVEFVVRGYLYGSAWEKYRKGKPICGISLPKGLEKAEQLPNFILTPTTKAEAGHDVEMTQKEVVDKVGRDLSEKIEEVCLKIYGRALKKAEAKGIILADTKLEFGVLDNELLLIDELLTPDSSRFWPKDQYKVGEDPPSFDKQFVRDYLTSIGWNRQPPAPELPASVIRETSRKYVEAYEWLTGRNF